MLVSSYMDKNSVSSIVWLLFFIVVSRFVISSCCFFFFQAEDGIRDLVRSRGLGDVYKRQGNYTDNLSCIADIYCDCCQEPTYTQSGNQ